MFPISGKEDRPSRTELPEPKYTSKIRTLSNDLRTYKRWRLQFIMDIKIPIYISLSFYFIIY